MEQTQSTSEIDVLRQRLQRLEAENEALSRNLRQLKRKPSKLWGLALLASGVFSITAAMTYSSVILTFTGLGLTFWGALLLYIRPVKYTRKELLEATAPNTMEALNQLIDQTEYTGRGIHMPKSGEAYGSILVIPRSDAIGVDTRKRVIGQTSTFAELTLTPPGLGLARLLQRELGRDLSSVDLAYIVTNLPKVLVEDLELADDLNVEPSENVILVRVKDPQLVSRNRKRAELDYLPSAIACILTWVMGKPVTINRVMSQDMREEQFRLSVG